MLNDGGNEPVGALAEQGFSRRRFLQAAAVTGASAVVPGGTLAQATNSRSANPPEGSLPNPVVPNFSGQYGAASLPAFQVPKRAMGSTGLQVSILGMGGFHIGTVSTQDEVNGMVAKA